MAKTTAQKIAHINGTMAMENMHLSNEDRRTLQDCYDGKTTVEQEKERIIAQYRKKNG